MNKEERYSVALFVSVGHVIKAEKILKKAGIPHKVIPVPRSISSDCGVCVRFLTEDKDRVKAALSELVPINEFREL
ncbi:MAG: DUF3343 domain-containing protein [Syntrophorhabdaceae bacterium]|nr:DUF3343 domain-containing protein [Syntrophorhabdaceae bacterium]